MAINTAGRFENLFGGETEETAPLFTPPKSLESRQLPIPAMSNLPADPNAADDIIEMLRKRIKGEENPVTTGSANIGSVLGGLADTEQQNRVGKGAATQGYDRLMLDAQTGRNQNEQDALRKLAIAGYLKGGGYKGGPTSIMMDGQMRQLPSYGSAARPASAAQMKGAGTLEDMLVQRLASGGSYLPQDLSGYATPGKLEKAAGYGGAAVSGLGAINDMLGDKANIWKAIGGKVISGLTKNKSQ